LQRFVLTEIPFNTRSFGYSKNFYLNESGLCNSEIYALAENLMGNFEN